MSGTIPEYAQVPGVSPVLHESAGTVKKPVEVRLLREPADPMRHNMDDEAMGELMDSIRAHGLLQNLCVVPVDRDGCRLTLNVSLEACQRHERDGGLYRVCCGHRRLLACRAINLFAADCKVYCDATIAEETIMAQENGIREEPSDFDLAVLYTKWLKEDGLTETELKKRAGKSLDFIYARAQLLAGWEEVAKALHAHKITFAVARELNRIEGEDWMKHFLSMAVDQGATRRLVHGWIGEMEGLLARQASVGAPAQPASNVTTSTYVQTECIACGETASFNLTVQPVCHTCREALRVARAQVDAQCDPSQSTKDAQT